MHIVYIENVHDKYLYMAKIENIVMYQTQLGLKQRIER